MLQIPNNINKSTDNKSHIFTKKPIYIHLTYIKYVDAKFLSKYTIEKIQKIYGNPNSWYDAYICYTCNMPLNEGIINVIVITFVQKNDQCHSFQKFYPPHISSRWVSYTPKVNICYQFHINEDILNGYIEFLIIVELFILQKNDKYHSLQRFYPPYKSYRLLSCTTNAYTYYPCNMVLILGNINKKFQKICRNPNVWKCYTIKSALEYNCELLNNIKTNFVHKNARYHSFQWVYPPFKSSKLFSYTSDACTCYLCSILVNPNILKVHLSKNALEYNSGFINIIRSIFVQKTARCQALHSVYPLCKSCRIFAYSYDAYIYYSCSITLVPSNINKPIFNKIHTFTNSLVCIHLTYIRHTAKKIDFKFEDEKFQKICNSPNNLKFHFKFSALEYIGGFLNIIGTIFVHKNARYHPFQSCYLPSKSIRLLLHTSYVFANVEITKELNKVRHDTDTRFVKVEGSVARICSEVSKINRQVAELSSAQNIVQKNDQYHSFQRCHPPCKSSRLFSYTSDVIIWYQCNTKLIPNNINKSIYNDFYIFTYNSVHEYFTYIIHAVDNIGIIMVLKNARYHSFQSFYSPVRSSRLFVCTSDTYIWYLCSDVTKSIYNKLCTSADNLVYTHFAYIKYAVEEFYFKNTVKKSCKIYGNPNILRFHFDTNALKLNDGLSNCVGMNIVHKNARYHPLQCSIPSLKLCKLLLYENYEYAVVKCGYYYNIYLVFEIISGELRFIPKKETPMKETQQLATEWYISETYDLRSNLNDWKLHFNICALVSNNGFFKCNPKCKCLTCFNQGFTCFSKGFTSANASPNASLASTRASLVQQMPHLLQQRLHFTKCLTCFTNCLTCFSKCLTCFNQGFTCFSKGFTSANASTKASLQPGLHLLQQRLHFSKCFTFVLHQMPRLLQQMLHFSKCLACFIGFLTNLGIVFIHKNSRYQTFQNFYPPFKSDKSFSNTSNVYIYYICNMLLVKKNINKNVSTFEYNNWLLNDMGKNLIHKNFLYNSSQSVHPPHKSSRLVLCTSNAYICHVYNMMSVPSSFNKSIYNTVYISMKNSMYIHCTNTKYAILRFHIKYDAKKPRKIYGNPNNCEFHFDASAWESNYEFLKNIKNKNIGIILVQKNARVHSVHDIYPPFEPSRSFSNTTNEYICCLYEMLLIPSNINNFNYYINMMMSLLNYLRMTKIFDMGIDGTAFLWFNKGGDGVKGVTKVVPKGLVGRNEMATLTCESALACASALGKSGVFDKLRIAADRSGSKKRVKQADGKFKNVQHLRKFNKIYANPSYLRLHFNVVYIRYAVQKSHSKITVEKFHKICNNLNEWKFQANENALKCNSEFLNGIEIIFVQKNVRYQAFQNCYPPFRSSRWFSHTSGVYICYQSYTNAVALMYYSKFLNVLEINFVQKNNKYHSLHNFYPPCKSSRLFSYTSDEYTCYPCSMLLVPNSMIRSIYKKLYIPTVYIYSTYVKHVVEDSDVKYVVEKSDKKVHKICGKKNYWKFHLIQNASECIDGVLNNIRTNLVQKEIRYHAFYKLYPRVNQVVYLHMRTIRISIIYQICLQYPV